MAPRVGDGLGLPERLQVELPAPCIGHPLLGNVPCPAEGSLTLWGVVEDDEGAPMPVLVTVCPKHASPVQHWLETLGNRDPIERWSTATFFENDDIVIASGLDWHRLTRIA